MFNAARDLPWMDALENIIDVMIRQNLCVPENVRMGE
jgi:hypothetical protein